jgi:hypothetical protein
LSGHFLWAGFAVGDGVAATHLNRGNPTHVQSILKRKTPDAINAPGVLSSA